MFSGLSPNFHLARFVIKKNSWELTHDTSRIAERGWAGTSLPDTQGNGQSFAFLNAVEVPLAERELQMRSV